ncbi:uncharacterized protein LOC127286706 [Leptopilina boulardi]|uniref:uncharacterized protein LOC127286706 n=1 Tax=Leptopilina boulardi TaxID=63433 RepID=UPI0021F5DE31|nr:uncharacterized protein LOC127286706 [Leptopilina boulardi]
MRTSLVLILVLALVLNATAIRRRRTSQCNNKTSCKLYAKYELLDDCEESYECRKVKRRVYYYFDDIGDYYWYCPPVTYVPTVYYPVYYAPCYPTCRRQNEDGFIDYY